MSIYEVLNIEEAVELAQKLKEEGHYNWFRGQVGDWPPYSSLFRIQQSGDTEKLEQATRLRDRFLRWIAEIEELRYLTEQDLADDIFAIMQHYGTPTHYIDFTTDPGVAGFFAADTSTPPNDGRSCIYCLNTDDLIEVWDLVKHSDSRKGRSIELITVDVQNLWRLQAQRGVFLYVNYNWDVDYPMDRILFPYTGYPPYPTRERIYPDKKSPLEQILDQFDLIEDNIKNWEIIQKFTEEQKTKGIDIPTIILSLPPKGYVSKVFDIPPDSVPLESWAPEKLRSWKDYPTEDYHQTVGETRRMEIRPQQNAEETAKSLSFAMKQILRSEPNIRSKSLDLDFSHLPESISKDELNDMLRTVWNGMRRLPYETNEIADAFGSVVALLSVGFGEVKDPDTNSKLFSQCFGESVHVGFDNPDKSGSEGFVTKESLGNAIRSDIGDLLTLENKKLAEDLRQLLQVVTNPKLMFEFNPFKGMFARELIPSQVVSRRTLIIFNPAGLIGFGNF